MTDDELERLLGEAFDARARSAIGDAAAAPPPRFEAVLRSAADLTETANMANVVGPDGLGDPLRARRGSRHRRRRTGPRRALAPLAAAAAVVAIAGGALGISRLADSESGPHGSGQAAGPAAPSTSRPAAVTSSGHTTTPVHIQLLNSDGDQYGVGMPVIAYFSKRITDARALSRATTVTVDGSARPAAWYFERSAAGHGPVEGHLRLQGYWPAHAKVHVAMPVRGRSAGSGLVYDNSLTLDFRTGAALISVVNDRTHQMTVTRDGVRVGSYPVSLGASATPTSHGTKVIMERGRSICMSGPGYHECNIEYTQRLTYGGEYLHSAPWNATNIKAGRDTSNGCTNLLPDDARTLYDTFEIGDVVQYPNADGPAMTLGAGYGDWNVDWGTWQTGGLVRTH